MTSVRCPPHRALLVWPASIYALARRLLDGAGVFRGILPLLVIGLASPGCSAFRAEFGVGPGLGADVHMSGLVHTGALAAMNITGGTTYGEQSGGLGATLTVPAFHYELIFLGGPCGGTQYQHSSLGLLPPLTGGVSGTEVRSRPWAFELALGLGLVMIRIGVDPSVLFDPDPDCTEDAREPVRR